MRIEAGAMRSDIALPNLRRRIQEQLVAPLDAAPNAVRAAGSMDPVLAAVVVALVGFGVVMVYSASTVYATTTFKDPQYFLARQGMYAVVALAVLFITSRFDYHRLYKLTYPVLAGVGILMVLCVAGLGHSAGGATRWISIGPVHVQPAEMAKLAIVLWLAYSLAKKADKVKSFAVGFLPHLLVAGFFMFLCMKHTDLGSSVVLLLLTFTMLFVAGAKLGYILGAGILGTTFGVAAIRYSAFRNSRYQAWLHLDEHKQDVGYQVWQSLISIGSGETWGVGLGRGLQTLYLPEAHTDFVAAIVGEELGFVGILLLCVAYLILVLRGLRAALRAPDDYGFYIGVGIAAMFGLQVLVNLSVVLALVPTKGLTLPFVSFGGSSILVNSAAAGILLSVSRQGEAKA